MHISGTDIKIVVNDITICYDDLGSGNIPILFIHGFPFNKHSWQPQINFLKKNHRVIAFDIRGFGNSGSDETESSMDLLANDLIAFMDELKIKRVIGCGLSMGGYILLNAVNRFPERFNAIVLCDTQCIADSPETKEKRYQSIEQIKGHGLNDFVKNFISVIFCKESLLTKEKLIEEIKNTILSTSHKTITDTLRMLAHRKDMCGSLKEIAIPTLIICGEEDTVTPMIQSTFLLNHISNAILHSISNAGHLSNLEQPDKFNIHLNNFVSEIQPSV